MKKVFKGKGKIGNKDATVIGNYLYKLSKEGEVILQARDVVEVARDEKNILHKYFTWDDNKAAEEYRIWQARQLIASVVEVRIVDHKNREVRSFWNIKSEDEERAYVTYDVMTSNEDYIEQLLTEIQEEMKRCMQAIDMLKIHRRKLALVRR